MCKIKNKSKKIECNRILQDREIIFNTFWQHMNWSERKIYIHGLVKIENVQRRRGIEESSRRNFSLKYHLKVNNNVIRVYKQMFLKTLVMKESTVLNWIKTDKLQETERKNTDKRNEARRKIYENKNKKLFFFYSLPKVETHHCRLYSSKLYLEPMWNSTNELFQFYKHHFCPDNNIIPVYRTFL